VGALLVGFTLGPSVGLPAWLVALAADGVLVAVTRFALTLPVVLPALAVAAATLAAERAL